MSLSRSAALWRHEVRLVRAEAASYLSIVLMPIIMIVFLKPFARLALQGEHAGANGSEFTVPAMATMFAFFLVGHMGFTFFTERQQGTLERLRASPATNAEIMIGKVVPAFGIAAVQQAVLFAVGYLAIGLRLSGSWLALALVVMVLCVCLTSLGVLVASVFSKAQQLNAVTNLGTMLLAGISGAFVPVELLPGWARAVAPIAPQYWALRGYRSVILEGGGLSSVALPVVVLLAISAGAVVLALLRFRFDEPNVRAVKAVVAPAPA
jgi:ABC-2 type transport system permease protein